MTAIAACVFAAASAYAPTVNLMPVPCTKTHDIRGMRRLQKKRGVDGCPAICCAVGLSMCSARLAHGERRHRSRKRLGHCSGIARRFRDNDGSCVEGVTAAAYGAAASIYTAAGLDLSPVDTERTKHAVNLAFTCNRCHDDGTVQDDADVDRSTAGPPYPQRLNEKLANGRLALMARLTSAFSPQGTRWTITGSSGTSRAWHAPKSLARGSPCALIARGVLGESDEPAPGVAPVAAEQEEAAISKPPRNRGEDESLWVGDSNAEVPFYPAEQIGVTAPLAFFDPLGFCKSRDRDEFRKLRASELKHGRVAMLASVGAVVQHYVKLPGFERARTSFESQYLAVFSAPGIYFFVPTILAMFFMELSFWAQSEDREPGDFGDPLGLNMYDAEMRNRELNNGRFAMFATTGIIAAQLYTGKDAVQQFGFF